MTVASRGWPVRPRWHHYARPWLRLLCVTSNSQVDDQLVLHPVGTIDVQGSDVEFRLNGITGLSCGTIQGSGIARQNEMVFVTGDTRVNVDTYDSGQQRGAD